MAALCQISENFCISDFTFEKIILKQYFSHHNILTLFDTVAKEQSSFILICSDISHVLHAQKQVMGLWNSLDKLCCKRFLLQVSGRVYWLITCKDYAWEARSSSTVIKGEEEEKEEVVQTQCCKALLKPLYGDKNHPNPVVQLSNIWRDTNIGKDARFHLFALVLLTCFWRKSGTTHT